jgi:hypothetical protein
MQVVVWIQKTESSSAKEQDGEFERKKANDEVIPIHPRDSFLYPLPRRFEKHHVWCLVPSPPMQLAPPITRGSRVHLSDSVGQTTGNPK